MSWVVENARTIKRVCWVFVVILSLLTVIGIADRFQRQRVMFLEGQQALLTQRSAWNYSNLVRQQQTHKLQQTLLEADPPPPGCLSDEYIAMQQRTTEIQSAGVDELKQFTLRVPIHQVAPLPSPQRPRLSLQEGQIQMTSRQLLGYSCGGGDVVIQETQTRLQAQPLPPRTAAGPAFVDRLVVHVAVTDDQMPTWYFDIHFTPNNAEYIPATGAGWPASLPTEGPDQERFVRQFSNLHQGLQMRYYSEPLVENFLPQFLKWNSFGMLLLVGIIMCLLMINWLVMHLVDSSVVQYRAATRDYLTGLYNRRAAISIAEAELARATRKPSSLCVLMVDIDHFKLVNDTYGHDGGDEVLKFFAQLLNQTLRQPDLVARFGGEEFLIVLPDTDLTGAQTMAERLLQTLHNSMLEYGGRSFGVTCSMGVAAWRGPEENFSTLLVRADLLLYQAKQQGRDRYVSEYCRTPSLHTHV
ncbi:MULTISPECIES: GGDEF domain-containing protein [unclassified Pseudomonas]|jgi:diguanylate cyclase (GGDEF)-like protein|uniref:GGDEF domain-containing protein n=1 Tax=unclassified Pseudomonas TaxID=196821 RepID=UPI00069D92FD|nr:MULTISPECIES: GGDEF domain-containing protein [unclassified Pseudomonas]WPN44540.1 GGDEF domain-containing protein [Pseudomonas sp. P8_241]